MAQAEAISTTRELPAPRRWPWPLAIVIGLGILVLLAAVIRLGPLTPLGRSWIVSVATGQKIGRFGRLEVDGLRGDVWGDFSVGRLAIRDPRGVWIEARDLTMRWDAGDLLHRRLHIRAITAGRVAVLRRPNLGPVTPPTPSLVSVDLDAVRGRIELEPALSGRLGVYDLRAALRVERQGPLAGWLTAASVLAAGDFLRANFDLGHKGAFRVVADGVEANGGALAGAAGLAADKPFALHARASGDARSGAFNLVTRVGASTPLQGVGAWNEAGGRARGRVDLAASSFLARYVAMVGPSASFDVAGRGAGVGRFAVRAVARTDNVTATGAGEIDLAHLATGPKGLAVELAAADVGRLLATRGFGSGRLTGTLTGDTREWRFAGAQRLQAIRTANYTL
ncbi:MAG: translocation/assembly module TamB, partial [Caulobacteraceae bacterium]